MHIVSDKSLQRADYTYNKHGVGYPTGMKPSMVWKHIDGPLLVCRNGAMHWLTWGERVRMWLGREDIYSLERKHIY